VSRFVFAAGESPNTAGRVPPASNAAFGRSERRAGDRRALVVAVDEWALRKALRQAWGLDDADKALRLLRNLVRRLDEEAPTLRASILVDPNADGV
jgi:hypothetical protein